MKQLVLLSLLMNSKLFVQFKRNSSLLLLKVCPSSKSQNLMRVCLLNLLLLLILDVSMKWGYNDQYLLPIVTSSIKGVVDLLKHVVLMMMKKKKMVKMVLLVLLVLLLKVPSVDLLQVLNRIMLLVVQVRVVVLLVEELKLLLLQMLKNLLCLLVSLKVYMLL